MVDFDCEYSPDPGPLTVTRECQCGHTIVIRIFEIQDMVEVRCPECDALALRAWATEDAAEWESP